jgi:hypothetical protein
MQRFVDDGLGLRLSRYRAMLRCSPPLMRLGISRAALYNLGLGSLSPWERANTVRHKFCR